MPEQTMQERTTAAPEPAQPVKTLNYQELRKMVEDAASYRDQDVYIVVDHSGWSVVREKPGNTEGKAVIPVRSPGSPVARKPVAIAQIGTDEKQPVNLLMLTTRTGIELGPADAVFWTPAAVEKFVVPYYASVYGDQAPRMLEAVIGVLGTVRTEPGKVHPASKGQAPAPLESPAFALAHMPKSEYVQVDDRFAVLTSTPEGKVEVATLREYAGWK